MRVLSFIFVFAALFGLVTAKTLWNQIEEADFTFVKTTGGGDRETKKIVHLYARTLGVPLAGQQTGLYIVPGEDDLLDAMVPPLRRGLQDFTPTPLIESILSDSSKRKDVVATTENNYTHALHGMFMLVINTILEAEPFTTLIKRYRTQNFLRPSTPALVLDPKEVLSTVEFKIGGSTFERDCAFLDRFYASGGSAVAIWSPPTPGLPQGVIHYIPIVNEVVVTDPQDLAQYDTMFDRIMEAAATALWADTKLTLFAAGSQYFAAGPAGGYGVHTVARKPANAHGKRAVDAEDDDKASKANTGAIKKARAAFRQADQADKEFVEAALANKVPVNSKVIYLPTYGTKLRPANFLGHVLALTWNKLQVSLAESKLKLDHSARPGKKHALDEPSTSERPPRPSKSSKQAQPTRRKPKRQDTMSEDKGASP